MGWQCCEPRHARPRCGGQGGCLEGVCLGQALGPTEPAYGLARDAPVPAEPAAALLLPTASVIYGRGCCFAGPFPEGGEGCPGLPGARSARAGIAGSIGGNRGRGSTVCPSHLDLPPAKVKYFKEAQGDDLVNGCMTQVLPCGVGFFVSPILLFTPVGNHGGWGVVAGVSFAQLRLNCASSASHWCEKGCQPFPVPLTQLFLGQQSPYGTSLWLLVELLLPCSIFWGWTVDLKTVSTRGAPAPMPLGFGGIG